MAPPAEIFQHSISDDSEEDSPEKCRLRRRRRIEKRRLKFGASWHLFPPLSPDNHLEHSQPPGVRVMPTMGPSWMRFSTENPMPVFGSMSVRGLSGRMDDAIFVKPEFCRPEIVGRKPLHFFAVYDGHGDPHLSTIYRQMMHLFLEEELKRVWTTTASASGDSSSSSNSVQQNQELDEDEWEETLRAAIKRTFQRMAQLVALNSSPFGQTGYKFGYQPMGLGFAGSHVVMAIFTLGHIVVAKCGDSRAVLCRAGRAIPLSLDHELERPDERERIHAVDGWLVHKNEVQDYGILLSRSLGDKFSNSVAISQPEISITERDPEDECLILGTNGLWDVLSDDMACNVACTCLRDGGNNPAAAAADPRLMITNSRSSFKGDGLAVFFQSQTAMAATILCRLALARGSSHNISVIVVDLKRREDRR